MPSYHEAKIEVERLVNHFASLSPKQLKTYNEAATRQEFILPLFHALGWDTRNAREVSPEEQVSRGRVDFSFRLNGVPRFFLETKKISENLDDPRWAKQAINYAWLKSVSWAVLSDFEEMRILNAEWQESIPQRAIFKGLNWREYVDRFDDLMLLSKEAIRDGEIDRIAESVGRKIRRTPVNRQLFEDLAAWRRELFRHLRPYNRLWSIEQVDEAVQRILNRLIFIRTVEDRRIEEERLMPLLRQLEAEGRKGDVVKRLSALFRDFDEVYNERLFAPHFSENAQSEAEPYIKIIEGLHDVHGGYGFYDFSAIDADVLGTIYEQYLGYVAQDPEATQVVSKLGKRKSQGIFYTPQYIVRHIVQQTLGRMLEEEGLEWALNIKVLDPACGSGSFLLEAFNVLDNFIAHESGQIIGANPEADAARRKHILTHNLYGIDLDAQAVEITKLNLWLRSVGNQGHLAPLNNIRQGNSLIDNPEAAGSLALDWEREFPEVMRKGGFDLVIGNPPYVRSIVLKEGNLALWNAYRSNYRAASSREWDIYFLFVERGLSLLHEAGRLGYILPNKFLNSQVGENLRAILSEGQHLRKLVHFGAFQVFPEATTYTCLLFLDRKGSKEAEVARYIGSVDKSGIQCPLPEEAPLQWAITSVSSGELTSANWEFSASGGALLEKLKRWTNLGNVADVFQGTGTRADRVYAVKGRERAGHLIRVFSSEKDKEYLLEPIFLKPVLRGRSINRYHIEYQNLLLIVPYRVNNGKSILVSERDLSHLAPRTLDYLYECKARLDERENGRFKGVDWYCFGRPQNMQRFEVAEKIVLPDVANRGTCFLDREGKWLLDTAYAITLKSDIPLSLSFILGILNSPLLTYFLKELGTPLRGGYFRMKTAYLNPFPIRTIDFRNAKDVAYHERMVTMVEEMLELQKDYAIADAMREDRRHDLASDIEDLDTQLNQLVYELYELTEEEIAIVEGN